MGKHGPCYHCGVTSTPLWRNGPPDKPVLCNACGSRWRTKGTLANYTPLHARSDPVDFEDHRVSKMKSASLYQNKEVNMLKRKLQHENGLLAGGIIPNDHSQNFHKTVDEDTSNRSSSGSAISNSESCAQFGSADASDLTGPAQSMVWDTMVPSRKRTCVNRSKPSSVEKLTKDLYTILQEQQSSYFSGSSEEDLLLESEAPMVSVEIGHGSVLIRHPSSIAREEESEASSLSIDNSRLYPINESYSSYSATFPVHSGVEIQSGKMKNLAGHGVQQEQCKRDKSQYEKAQVLGNHNSPLCNIDLTDVLNLEEFTRQLTDEEQKQLMKYLPQIDAVQLPDNLKCMFESLQFKENLTSFQQLLAEGVLDLSSPSAKFEDCKTLKRLALCNLSKSKWVERYHILKESKNSGGAAPVMGPTSVMSSNFMNAKRFFHDTQNKNFSDAKTMMKSPKRVMMKSPKRVMMKGSLENKELIDYESYCFSPRSLFALPSDRSSLPLESLQFVGESSDQDLLVDVRSNNSFPQAELLHPASTGSSSGYPNLVHNRFC